MNKYLQDEQGSIYKNKELFRKDYHMMTLMPWKNGTGWPNRENEG